MEKEIGCTVPGAVSVWGVVSTAVSGRNATTIGQGERIMYQIVEKADLTDITKLFRVKAPMVAKSAQPGQFVVVRISETGERIPLTIADYDREEGTVTIVVQAIGKTSTMMNDLKEGDFMLDFAGPLGKAAELPESGHVCLIGGGFGVAPVLPIAKALFGKEGIKVTSIIGARSQDLLILEDEMAAFSDELHVATDDGSKGHKGFVTQVLEQLHNKGSDFDVVYAIGPMPMMRAVGMTTKPWGLKTLVSVDPIMVDGTGMCGACRVTVGGETKFACVDGPIFDAHQVDFEEAHNRAKMYANLENQAMEHWKEHQCKREGVN